MLRIVLLAASFAILPQVASAQSLEGVWRGIGQRTIGGPNDGQVIEYDNPRLLIYTAASGMADTPSAALARGSRQGSWRSVGRSSGWAIVREGD